MLQSRPYATTGPRFGSQRTSGRCVNSLVRWLGRLVRIVSRMIGRRVVRRATLLAGAAIWIAARVIGALRRIATGHIRRRVVCRTSFLTRATIGVGVGIIGPRRRISECRGRQRNNRQASQYFQRLHHFLRELVAGHRSRPARSVARAFGYKAISLMAYFKALAPRVFPAPAFPLTDLAPDYMDLVSVVWGGSTAMAARIASRGNSFSALSARTARRSALSNASLVSTSRRHATARSRRRYG